MKLYQYRNAPPRQISHQEARYYFSPQRAPRWTLITLGLGILGTLGGCVEHYWPIITFGSISILVSFYIQYRIKRSNPDDEAYDRWVKEQSRTVRGRALQALGIDKSKLTDRPLPITSAILPGSVAAHNYPPYEVHMKCGQDGKWRFSVYVCTYVFPTDDFIGIFRCDIRALASSDSYGQAEMFPYAHIVRVTKMPRKETVELNDQTLNYRTEQLCLRMSNNDTFDITASTKAVPLERGAPPIVVVEDRKIEEMLRYLSQIIFNRDHHSH